MSIFDTHPFTIRTAGGTVRTNMIGDHSGFRSHTVHTSMVYNKQLKYVLFNYVFITFYVGLY